VEAARAGANGYIIKPFTTATLKSKVEMLFPDPPAARPRRRPCRDTACRTACCRRALRGGSSTLAEPDAVEPLVGLRGITADLGRRPEPFCAETRLDELASENVPDARLRLEHVLQLTDSAAHRTLDLVEQAYPIAERISRRAAELAWRHRQGMAAADAEVEAFLEEISTDVDRVRAQLSDVLLAQGYQDLTGQIIRACSDWSRSSRQR